MLIRNGRPTAVGVKACGYLIIDLLIIPPETCLVELSSTVQNTKTLGNTTLTFLHKVFTSIS